MDTRGLGRTSDACASLSRGTRGRLRCRRSRGRCGGQVLMMVVLLLMRVVLLASWPCALIYPSVGGMSVSRLSRLPARTCLMRMACTCLGALDRPLHASSIHGMYMPHLYMACTCLIYTWHVRVSALLAAWTCCHMYMPHVHIYTWHVRVSAPEISCSKRGSCRAGRIRSAEEAGKRGGAGGKQVPVIAFRILMWVCVRACACAGRGQGARMH